MANLIKLKDGRLFNPVTKEMLDPEGDAGHKDVKEAKVVESFTPKPRTQMRLEDLPAKPGSMNVICAILAYRLLGIPDTDICLALGCDDTTIERITASSAYDESYTEIIKAFASGQKHSARDVLSNGAVTAAKTLVKVMQESKNEAHRLRASENILSRTGITADGEVNEQNGGLRIKIVSATPDTSVTINVGN
jgi:hypothetical protein